MSNQVVPPTLEAAIIKALNENGWSLTSWTTNLSGGDDVVDPFKRLHISIGAIEAKVR